METAGNETIYIIISGCNRITRYSVLITMVLLYCSELNNMKQVYIFALHSHCEKVEITWRISAEEQPSPSLEGPY